MNEYKREKATLETRIEEIQKRSTYHDDHIRIADAWVLQVSSLAVYPWLRCERVTD